MRLKDISKEELETMNYDDIAYIILNEEKKQMKIGDLFKNVCSALNLSDDEYENKIADFFELLTTDKRFIMLEDGSWDLKELHNPKIIIDEEEDEALITEIEDDEMDIEPEEDSEENIFYDTDNDDDIPDNDLDDLVVIDVDEEEANN